MNDVRTGTSQERDALLERVKTMTREELDLLPVGLITLDLDGTILEYNRVEGEMSHRNAADQIGKHFFRDVAPCTASDAFEGRFRTLAAEGASGTVNFEYEFPFPWATERVNISFLRAVGGDRIFVVVTWGFDLERLT